MAATTGYRPVSRLPDPGPRGPRAGERLKALLALLALAALLIGVPAGLVLFVGNPLPDAMPDGENGARMMPLRGRNKAYRT